MSVCPRGISNLKVNADTRKGQSHCARIENRYPFLYSGGGPAHGSYKGWVVELCNWLGPVVAAFVRRGADNRKRLWLAPNDERETIRSWYVDSPDGPLFDLQRAICPKTTDGAGNCARPTVSTTLTLVQLLPFTSLTVKQVKTAIVLIKDGLTSFFDGTISVWRDTVAETNMLHKNKTKKIKQSDMTPLIK